MTRVKKTSRFDSELWGNLEQISITNGLPVSRLLDEGLKYLTDKYLGNGDKKSVFLKSEKAIRTDNQLLQPTEQTACKRIKTPSKTLPGVGEGVPDDLIPLYQSQPLIGIPKARIKYWVEQGKVQRYRKDGFNCVSKREVLAYQALRSNGIEDA